MSKRSLTVLTLLALLASPLSARAAQWTDDSFHLWYGTAFAEPGVVHADGTDLNVAKTILTFTHASGYKYGTNFLNVDFLYSNTSDPIVGAKPIPSVGALEVYAVYRHTLSLSKITASKVAFGPVRDVGLELGVDWNTKNNAFTARKIMPIGGVQLSFDVPGFLNLSFLVNKEWGTASPAAAATQSISYDPTLTVSAAWGLPVYGPVTLEGFAGLNLPKGKNAFGGDTTTELLLHPKLMVDVATLMGGKGVQVGGGYQLWLNKFGNDHTTLGGCYEKAAFAEVAIHL